MNVTLTDVVRNNNLVTFSYYRQGICYYRTNVNNVPYMFPVSIDSVGHASLFDEMKAIHLMPQLRKALEDNTFVSIANSKEAIRNGNVIDEQGNVVGMQG